MYEYVTEPADFGAYVDCHCTQANG
jgi:hypothetical protein